MASIKCLSISMIIESTESGAVNYISMHNNATDKKNELITVSLNMYSSLCTQSG